MKTFTRLEYTKVQAEFGDRIRTLSSQEKGEIINRYLSVLGLEREQFVAMWYENKTPDTFEALHLASLLRL